MAKPGEPERNHDHLQDGSPSHVQERHAGESLRDWPGVSAVRALLDGEPLVGHWFNRTREYAARQRGESFHRRQFATEYTLQLAPLPCWEHLDPEQYRQNILEIVEAIEARAAAEREASERPALGVQAIRALKRHDRPAKIKRAPAPLFHAASRKVRRDLYQAYGEFLCRRRSRPPLSAPCKLEVRYLERGDRPHELDQRRKAVAPFSR